MPFRRAAAEALREAFEELHRQRDLRQQDQHLLVRAQRLGDRLEIDFRLARSRHAVEQADRETLRRHIGAQPLRRFALRAVQCDRREGRIGHAKRRKLGKLGRGQRAGLDQPAHHGGGYAGLLRQRDHAARQPVIRQRQHAFACRRQPRGRRGPAHEGDAHRRRLEGAPAAQHHGQDHARRRQCVLRHPVDEIAQLLGDRRMAFERCGLFQAVVADASIRRAPNHAHLLARTQGRRNQKPAPHVCTSGQLVVIRAGQRQRQQHPGARRGLQQQILGRSQRRAFHAVHLGW